MVISPHFNYDKVEDGISITTPEISAQRLCSQLLSGDKGTDNIQGLPTLTRDLQEKYNLRKCNGIGKDTANNFISLLRFRNRHTNLIATASIARCNLTHLYKERISFQCCLSSGQNIFILSYVNNLPPNCLRVLYAFDLFNLLNQLR